MIVILTSSLDVTSPAAYKTENDVVRVKVAPIELPFAIENFLTFDNVQSSSVTMMPLWEKTMIPVNIYLKWTAKYAAATGCCYER